VELPHRPYFFTFLARRYILAEGKEEKPRNDHQEGAAVNMCIFFFPYIGK